MMKYNLKKSTRMNLFVLPESHGIIVARPGTDLTYDIDEENDTFRNPYNFLGDCCLQNSNVDMVDELRKQDYENLFQEKYSRIPGFESVSARAILTDNYAYVAVYFEPTPNYHEGYFTKNFVSFMTWLFERDYYICATIDLEEEFRVERGVDHFYTVSWGRPSKR